MEEKTIDIETLDGLAEHAKNVLQSAYNSSDDPNFEMMPTWIAKGPDGLYIVVTPFIGDTPQQAEQSKREILRIMRMMFAAKGITHYVMTSEAWMATALPGETMENHIQPSQREDRVEVVNMFGADRDGHKTGASFEIIREPGKPPRLGEDKFRGEGDIFGRMAEVLDNLPDMPEEVRRMASEAFDHLAQTLEPPTRH